MDTSLSYKKFFINYGIFISIIFLFILILIYPIKAGQKSWVNNLKSNIEFVLDESDPNSWTVENPVKINNPFSLTSACYEARNRKNGETYKAIIIRIQTFYGPLPAVFTVDKNNNVTLIGFSSLHGRIKNQAIDNISNKRIEYWKAKIPEIIK